MRLDKYLTASRAGSRSEVKNHIRKGLVQVNQSVCKDPSLHVGADDEVSHDVEQLADRVDDDGLVGCLRDLVQG